MAGQELTLDPVEQIMEHIAAGRHFVLNGGAGSGKTYFALQHIPSLTADAVHEVVYLIDTINGK